MDLEKISPIVVHLFVVVIAYSVMHHFGLVDVWPTEKKLLAWDAMWYNSIQLDGYQFVPFKTCNLAFFPLFPIIWNTLAVSSQAISIFNIVIFSAAIHFLLKGDHYPAILKFLLMATPSYLFFALPYSEAIFFMFGTLLILAFIENNTVLRLVSFFFLSLSRAVAVVFIPALVFSELLSNRTRSLKEKIKSLILNLIASGLGLLLAAYIQYYQTGKWFYFIQVQRFWKRAWILPRFPFRTYRQEDILSIDGIAVGIGLITIFICLTWAIKAVLNLRNNQSLTVPVKQQVIFSAAVIATTAVIDMCFTHLIANGANIWSINRHVLCSPFCVLLLLWIYKDFKPSRGEQYIIGLLLCAGIYVSGVFAYPVHLSFYLLFFASFIVIKYFPEYCNVVWGTYALSLYFQLTFYSDFLHYRWIG